MAALSRIQVGVKEFGRDVDVSESPKAQLMYYLDSICYVLDIDKTERNIRRLRDYKNHHLLTDDETDQLLIICILFSPDELINKCIFQDDDMCGNSVNKFYELSAVADRFLITSDVIIGGQRQHVKKILCFREIWIHQCYIGPMRHFQSRIRAISDRIDRRRGQESANRQVSSGQRQVNRPQTSTSSGSRQISRSQATQSQERQVTRDQTETTSSSRCVIS